eukprot:950973-Rhodomonas_salina.1
MGLNYVAPTTDEDSSTAGRADYAFEHALAAHIPFALVDCEFAHVAGIKGPQTDQAKQPASTGN